MNNFKISLLLIFVIAVIVSAVVLANNWRNNVNFNKITIQGNYTLSKEEISKHPEIKNVFVSKEPPAELRIEITEKRPVAIVNLGNELKLVDKDLEIFSFKNFEKIFDLPVINGLSVAGSQKSGIGEKEDDLRLALFIILNALKEGKYLYSQISEINMTDSNKVIIYSNENSIPFYLPKYKDKNITNVDYQKEIVNKLVILESFLEQIYSKNIQKKPLYVDLRFSNHVVVKYQNKN
jgi:cell division septal protein FtsQ